MRYEYGERDVYNQLLYLASLWDVERARDKVNGGGSSGASDKDKVLALAEHNRVRFATVKGVVDKHLDKCGRQWVAMDTLFGKLGFAVTI